MKRTRDGEPWEDAESRSGAMCETCRNENPQIRYAHYLAIAKFDGIEGIKKHLENATTFQPLTSKGIVQWIREQMEIWTGLADATTGAAIPWYTARQQAIHDIRGLGPVRDTSQYTDRLTAYRHAEQAQKTSRDLAWSQGHILLNQRGLNKPGREHEAAAFCREMATAHPQDAVEWTREAEVYALMASGKPQWAAFDTADNEDIPF